MKRLVLGIMAASLVAPAVKADSNVVERAEKFLANKVYTNPATTESIDILFAKSIFAVAYNVGLYRLSKKIVSVEASAMAEVNSLRSQVAELSAKQAELSLAIDNANAELKPLEAKTKFLESYTSNPGQALQNLQDSLIETQKASTAALNNAKINAREMSLLIEKQVMAGEAIASDIGSSIAKHSQNIAELNGKLTSLSTEISAVEAAKLNGNKLVGMTVDDILVLGGKISQQKAIIESSTQALEKALYDLQAAESSLSKASEKAARTVSANLGRKVLRGIGKVANYVLLADIAGSVYVINVLDRDPGISAIGEVTMSPAVHAKVKEMAKNVSQMKAPIPN